MNYKKVFFEENIPINFEMIKKKAVYECWQKELQIGYVISGKMDLKLNFQNNKYTKEEIFLINPNEIYSIIPQTEEIEIFMIYINIEYLSVFLEELLVSSFQMPEFIDNREEVTKYLKKCISSIFSAYKNLERDYKSKLLRVTLELCEFLLNNCKINNKLHRIEPFDKNKIIKISEYIDKNYSEQLNLRILSEKFNLNSQYISRFFKENVGVGFQEYLNSLRIKKSISDLLYSNKSILDIALDNGFSEGKNYSRAFRKEYGINPVEFRKKKHNNFTEVKREELPKEYESILLPDDSQIQNFSKDPAIVDEFVEVDANKYKPFENNVNKIITFGRAYEGLMADVQNQLTEIQKTFNYEYIRFTGIFNEDMHVYFEDENGNSIYNWNYTDKLIDFLVSIKLKPFINLGYMPEKMASDNKYIFKWKGNISYPKDIEKWNKFITNFASHLVDRYGIEEVESWYFEIWNNPDVDIFWAGSKQKYFEFFRNTLNSIKNVSKSIKVGGPSGNSVYKKEYYNLWIRDLYNYLSSNKYNLDFFSAHFYRYRHNKETDFLSYINKKESIQNLKNLYDEFQLNFHGRIELIVTEWNPGKMYGNYTQDTCYMATNIVYDFINTLNFVPKLAYWSFTDIFEEYGVSQDIFHGGFGLFTINNLKKASYNAFYLINRLGNNIIEKGEDWIITRNKNKIQILLCNYIEFDKGNFSDAKQNVDFFNRYSVFEEKVKNIKIKIKNLEKGTYYVKRTRLNRSSGSVFDAWIQMGAPQNINNEIINILKSKENMDFYIKKEEVLKDIEIDESLIAHNVTLFEIEKLI